MQAFPETAAVLAALQARCEAGQCTASTEDLARQLASAAALLLAADGTDGVAAEHLQALALHDALTLWQAPARRRETRQRAAKKEPAEVVASGVLSLGRRKQVSKRRSGMGPAARAVMTRWLEGNVEYPYPSEQEKAALATSAGVQKEQVTNFFINARGRSLWRNLVKERGMVVVRDETNKWRALPP